ncbi:hypothetical protein K435DRAFT_795948 [Dendrothele bispora CBS 962.96]|uniref:Uncharacterized protein n=1 Tax=Dendrothele bispora (strain CBS 962.96) TaxID=1314807 RepID=A0A4S8M756_DENBC|nr:hypothetical protein K435DRAFT_795948 [Dendrothele bispora CBS 962.96]
MSQSSESPTINPKICFSEDQPHLSCRASFPEKNYIGLCGRCHLLQGATDDTDHKSKSNWPQCEDCGAVSTTIPDSRTTCGGCYQNRKKNAGNQPDSQDSIEEKARQAQQLKEDERRNGMSARGLIGANRKISAAPCAGAANNAVRLITTYLCPIGEKGSNPKSRLAGVCGTPVALIAYKRTLSSKEFDGRFDDKLNGKLRVSFRSSGIRFNLDLGSMLSSVIVD